MGNLSMQVSDTTASIPPGFHPIPLNSVDDFVGINGPFYVYQHGDTLQVGFRVEKRHTNPLGICHGGMMATFCDMVLPITVVHKTNEVGKRFLPTISLQIDYIAAAPLGAWVQGEADILRLTRSLAFVQALVTADDI